MKVATLSGIRDMTTDEIAAYEAERKINARQLIRQRLDDKYNNEDQKKIRIGENFLNMSDRDLILITNLYIKSQQDPDFTVNISGANGNDILCDNRKIENIHNKMLTRLLKARNNRAKKIEEIENTSDDELLSVDIDSGWD